MVLIRDLIDEFLMKSQCGLLKDWCNLCGSGFDSHEKLMLG